MIKKWTRAINRCVRAKAKKKKRKKKNRIFNIWSTRFVIPREKICYRRRIIEIRIKKKNEKSNETYIRYYFRVSFNRTSSIRSSKRITVFQVKSNNLERERGKERKKVGILLEIFPRRWRIPSRWSEKVKLYICSIDFGL